MKNITMKNKDIVLQQRPLFNHSSGSLFFTATTIMQVLNTYNEQMADEVGDSFKEDIHVVLYEMAQRN
jgi:hypothetical protein